MNTKKEIRSFIKYSSVGGIGALLIVFLLWLFVDKIGVSMEIYGGLELLGSFFL